MFLEYPQRAARRPTLRITGWQWSAAELPVRVDAVVSCSFNKFEITGLPGLVEPRLQRAVEAQEHVEALAGHGLDPVALVALAGAFGPNHIV